MNYPTTVTNPLLKKHTAKALVKNESRAELPAKFSNDERPVSCPQVPLQRPFSAHFQSGLKFQQTRMLSKPGTEKMTRSSIENTMRFRQTMAKNEAAANNTDAATSQGDVLSGRMPMPAAPGLEQKPSVMSIEESDEEE